MARAVKVQVSVRSLVERVENSGDIHFRFSARSSAAEGNRGHKKLQKSRGHDYESEVAVTDTISLPEFELAVSGRADGCRAGAEALLVEEIKTLRVKVSRLPEAIKRLHWAQVRVYGYLLGRDRGVAAVNLRLTYYHLDEDQEYSFDDHWSMDELAKEYQRIVSDYVRFIRALNAWAAVRDQTITALSLPHGDFRPGQRELAVSVFRALRDRRQLVLQAPTGIGKTLGSLFPAIKALKDLQYERLFYLSAKTSGQQMAQSAIADMRREGLQLRDVTLTAKDKICFNPGVPCDPDYCEYARGYYDKLPAVMEQAVTQDGPFDRTRIETMARAANICPFELALDLSDIADVVIADYNYVFDPTVYLRRHFDEPGSYALLMDESHNLVERGREMFSASLSKQEVLGVRKLVGKDMSGVYRALDGINRQMLKLGKGVEATVRLACFPESFYQSVRRFTEAAETVLEEQQGHLQPELMSLYFDALRFLRVAEYSIEASKAQDNDGYACLVDSTAGMKLKLFCVDPARGLAGGFERMSASVCFSATLAPQAYFRSLMGLGDDCLWYGIPSPFTPDNLGVFTTGYLSTTYNNRHQSLYELVDTINLTVKARGGNYLVFFPSHAYLKMVVDKFQERHPEHDTIVQTPGMDDGERAEFLARFETGLPVVGFAVMGGVFGEGVDLKGSRLIGAIVVGVGLPQICAERNAIRDYFEAEGQGFEFAYQYPGMNRVLQTAGRVIRSESDRGIVCLIDHRFNEASYQALFPSEWQVQRARQSQHLQQLLHQFWNR